MHSLKPLHTFGFPTRAMSLLRVTSTEQLQLLANRVSAVPFCILGQGSNTVFLEDFAGQIVHIAIAGVEVKETSEAYTLEVGAGENWHDLVAWCIKNGIYGFENLALIPGTVGAAPIQNIGAYGVEIERFVAYVEYVCLSCGETKTVDHEQCQFAYRDSIFKHDLAAKAVISKVVFTLPKHYKPLSHYGELATLSSPGPEAIFKKVVEVRQQKLPDPKLLGNAGSFFKNPIIDKALAEQLRVKWPNIPQYSVTKDKVKIPAAWLIDTLGFKGKSLGGIRCHPTQALVLTNTGNGTGQELLSLARQIRQSVLQEFTIQLENEVQLLGASGLITL